MTTSSLSRPTTLPPAVVVAPALNDIQQGSLPDLVVDHPDPPAPKKPARSEEYMMGRALKLGALFGIPGVFLVTGMIGILGGAGVGPSALIGAWCGFFGGGLYLGGIGFLPRDHEIYARPPRPTLTTTTPVTDGATVAVTADTTSSIAMVHDSVTT